MSKPFAAKVVRDDFRSLQLINPLFQYASVADTGALDLQGAQDDFTIEMWIKRRTPLLVPPTQPLIGKWVAAGSQLSYLIRLFNNAGTPRLEALISENGSTADHVVLNQTFESGTWHHVAVSCDISEAAGTQFVFYVDGVSKGSGSIITNTGIANLKVSTAPFVIGGEGTGPVNNFDGFIDDVRVWNTVRNLADIQNNMFAELVGDEAGLVGYWKLNGDALDSTANANHLTLAGTVLPAFSRDGGSNA